MDILSLIIALLVGVLVFSLALLLLCKWLFPKVDDKIYREEEKKLFDVAAIRRKSGKQVFPFE